MGRVDQRGAPPCPRCQTALNVRRSWPEWGEPGIWTCRLCRFQVWKRQVIHDRERVIAEAEQITKEAA